MPSCCGSWGWKSEPHGARGRSHVTFESIIAQWGAVAVFLGAMLEGETAVLAGGLLSHQGLLHWQLAFVGAAAGSFLSDQFFFAAGRRYRDSPTVQRWTQKRAFAKALRLLERYPTSLIFGFRFLYGFRTVSPIAIGTSQVPASTFLVINAIAATVWASLFTALGYWFGEAVTELAGRLRPSRETLLMGVAVLGGIFVLFQILRWWRKR